MIKLKLLLIFSSIIAFSCHSTKTKELVVNFTQFSETVQDTFYINVQLPNEYYQNPDKRYPTVFLLYGNFYFPMMSSITSQYETAGLLDPVILVGIGYKSFTFMDSLRVRDYLYPKALPSDEMNAMGGGQLFSDYLTKGLLPKIDSDTGRKRITGLY